MVTSGLAVWKPATQASWAEPCEEAPAPLKVPDRSLTGASAPSAGASLVAQDESARAPTIARAATPPIRVIFTVFPSGMSVRVSRLLAASGRTLRTDSDQVRREW